MIVNVEQKDPLDIRDSVGVGVNLPFTGPAVFNTTYTTKDAMKANLINYFLTNKEERYLNPLFGSDIRLLLFENVNEDTVIELKARISKELKLFFPRVKPTTFEISGDPDNSTLRVYLRYQILNTSVEDEILININQ